MASTKQGARDFINSNWEKAVAGLNHIQLLLPELRTSRVLDEYEISAIDSCSERFEKNRTLLGMLVKKGNAACEVFLNLLDKGRKLSLDGRAHDWIDHFSFDASGPYRAQLKLAAREIVESKWKESRKLLADYVKELQFKYTPLILVSDVSDIYPESKYQKSRKKKCKRYIPKEEKPINVMNLLTMKEKKILLVGKPGIGKTFCVLQLLNLWTESDEDTLYVFYFDAKKVRQVGDSTDMRSLLFSYCKPDKMIENDLLNDIENGKANVLIIFDSFDEIQQTFHDQKIEQIIDRILEKSYLKEAKVIVTCRSSADECELSDWADCTMKVQGFSEKSISEYFKTTLEGQSVLEEIMEIYKKNINVFSLCHVPQYAFVVVCCMFNKDCIGLQQKISSMMPPSTVTKLYVHIFRYCVGQHMLKMACSKKGKVDNYITQNKFDVMILARKAFDGIISKSVNLIDCQLEEMHCESIKHCFLVSTSVDDTLTSKETCFAFLHNTMQEFFAALWILENKNNIRGMFQRYFNAGENHLKYVIFFLYGFLDRKNFKLMTSLFQEDLPKVISEPLFHNITEFIQSAEVDVGEEEIVLFACQCLYEAQSTKECVQVLEAINSEFCLKDEDIDPYQSHAVIYVVNEAFKEKYSDLEITDFGLLNLGYKLLFECTESSRAFGKKKSICIHCLSKYKDLNEFLKIMNFRLFVSLHWHSETLRTLGHLIKHSKKKVHIILDSAFGHDSHKTFILIMSESLEKLASIRFSTGFDEKTCIIMMEVCQKYDEITGDNSLYKVIALFEPFPINMDFKDSSWINQVDFSFLWKYLNVDTCPSLDRFIIGTLLNSSKDGLGCYKYICQYVQQSRNVTLSDKQVFVSCRWNKEILKKMINLAQCFLAKADIILDSIFNKVHDFICCVSCCLDKISSIRFPDGWNDTTFQKLCTLLYTYEELKDDNSLPQFISLFAPFSNNVPLAELDKTDVIDFSFLRRYLQEEVIAPEYKEVLQSLHQFIISTLQEAARKNKKNHINVWKYILDCGSQKDFNELLRKNEVHIYLNWTMESLNRMSSFIKQSSRKPDMILNYDNWYSDETFVHFLLNCLDWIFSIRFLDGFNEDTFWVLCYLFKQYEEIKGDGSLPHLISLFAPFPNKVPLTNERINEIDFSIFSFLQQYRQEKVTLPLHKEALQKFQQFIFSSIWEAGRKDWISYTWHYRCIVDCRNQEDFNESLRLSKNEFHVDPIWTEETLNRMSGFIKSFSNKVNIILDYNDIIESFVQFLSDCLDWIFSIRFLDGFNEETFWATCCLFKQYEEMKGDNSLLHLISSFASFPNMVPLTNIKRIYESDFSFLTRYRQDNVTDPQHKDALQQLRQFIFNSLWEVARENQITYTWYFKRIVDCGNQEDFTESMRLSNSKVYVDPDWTKEILKTMSDFIKCSSSEVDIIVDCGGTNEINERFVHFLSDGLDMISSIRFLNDFNERTFWAMCHLFNQYEEVKGHGSLPQLISLFAPFPNKVPLIEMERMYEGDFSDISFLKQYRQDNVTVTQYKKALQQLRRFIFSSLYEPEREERISNTWYYKCIVDCGNQEDFTESVTLTITDVHVDPDWTQETLKTISNFIKCSSSKVAIIVDYGGVNEIKERFVHFLSDCLDLITSIRFLEGFNEKNFWAMCRLFKHYEEIKGHKSLQRLISLFERFPNDVPLTNIERTDESDFSFLTRYHQDNVTVSWHKEALHQLWLCIFRSLWEVARKNWIRYTWYFKCIVDCGNQEDFTESLKLSNSKIHVDPDWTEEILKTMSNFIKCSSSKVDIMVDRGGTNKINERFIHFLSDCLDMISSIRFLDGFIEETFFAMCCLFKQYEHVKRHGSLPHLISLFAPFPNKVPLTNIDRFDEEVFSFLTQYHRDNVTIPQDKEALQQLWLFIFRSLLETERKNRISYTWYYKCTMDYGNQEDFTELLRLTKNEVHVVTDWTKKTLKTMSDFIKCSSNKVNLVMKYDDTNDRFIHVFSDCLDGISSIRFPDGFNEDTFWDMCHLFKQYEKMKQDDSLPCLISLFAPFPKTVPLTNIKKVKKFSFLRRYRQDNVTDPQQKEALQELWQFISSSLWEAVREKYQSYTWYFKFTVDCGNQKDFSESLRLRNNEIHMETLWKKKTLNRMSDFIKCSSSKVKLVIKYNDKKEKFVHFLSDCLDGISSIRFQDGFNEKTFWTLFHLFKQFEEVKGHSSLPHLISLFTPFASKVPLTNIERIYKSDFNDFRFLRRYRQDKVTVPQHKEALQQLRLFMFRSLLETERREQLSYTWHYKCIVDCGSQKDFNESLNLTYIEVHVDPDWTEETLKTMSNFIKFSSSKVDIIVDCGGANEINERFVHFLSDCLNMISSIRFLEGFNEKKLWAMCRLFKQYEDMKGHSSLPRLISLFEPFPNDVLLTNIERTDFSFLTRYRQDNITVSWHKEALQQLRLCIFRSLWGVVRENRIRYFKCIVDCGNQKDFTESLKLSNSKVHVDPDWTEEILKTMSNFIKCSSSKVGIIVHCGGTNEINERFVHFLSDCLDMISSIRFQKGFNEGRFWAMCHLFKQYEELNGHNSLPCLISLFAPFPNKMPLTNTKKFKKFSFLTQYHQDNVTVPQHKEALQQLWRFLFSSLMEDERGDQISFTWYFKCIVDCGNQEDFTESLKLSNSNVHVDPDWTEEILKTMSNFIKCSSSKVDIIVDFGGTNEVNEKFVHFLSDCLDMISSIRFLDDFNEGTFWAMRCLFKQYEEMKGCDTLPRLISLFAPFPNLTNTERSYESNFSDFNFLQRHHQDNVLVSRHKEALQQVQQFIFSSVLETGRGGQLSYTWHYKCIVDRGSQKDFNESLRLRKNEVHVDTDWTKKTLKTMSGFIKCCSSKVNIIVDYNDKIESFVHFLSYCLDSISSIRFLDGFNERTFSAMCHLFKQYEELKVHGNLSHLISLFAPFPNKVHLTDIERIYETKLSNFRFLKQYHQYKAMVPHHKEALQQLRLCIFKSLLEAARGGQISYTCYFKCIVDCGNQEDFTESLKLSNSKVHVATDWTMITLNRMSLFIKNSSVTVDLVMNYKDTNDRFVDFLSDCLDRISSMRFLDGFNEGTFWAMCHLFQKYEEVKGHESLPRLISLFAHFPNKVILTDIKRIYKTELNKFRFLRQYRQYKAAVPEHKDALQQVRRFIFGSIWETARENRITYSWYFKCIVDCGNQEDFTESMRLSNSKVHMNPDWTEEILKTMSNFIKCSSSKVNIIVDRGGTNEINERFIHFLSDCLDMISSIRFQDGFNEGRFWAMYHLFQQYVRVKGHSSLPHLISLFAPFPSKVPLTNIERIYKSDFNDFRFLRRYRQDKVTVPQHKEALQQLRLFMFRSLLETERGNQNSYTWYFKCIVYCGSQMDFNESLRLKNNEVHVDTDWTKKTLKTVSSFIKCFSSNVKIIVYYNNKIERFVHFLSDCLDSISSISFPEGFNEGRFWAMCCLFKQYEEMKVHGTLPHLISLFAPFPNKVPLTNTERIYESDFSDFSFLQQYHQDNVTVPQHKETLQQLRLFIFSSLWEAVRENRIRYTWYFKRIVDCGNQEDFTESMRLSNSKVYMDPDWTKEILKTMSNFIKCSSSKVDIIVDRGGTNEINERFIHFLSDCLDMISSIRFQDGFNEATFWAMCYLFQQYVRVKGHSSLPHLISLFTPFPSKVPLTNIERIYKSDFNDFRFLRRYRQDKVTVPKHKEAFQQLRLFMFRSLLETERGGQISYTWYFKCIVDCGNQEDFTESLKLSNSKVHVATDWTMITLNRMSLFIKNSSVKVNLVMNYKDRNDRFVDFLSDCLDRISSMRFLDGFNERTFWAMYHLFQNYKEVKGHDSLPHIISLFSPFPNDVPLTDIERIYESDFSFLRQYHQYKTRVSQHKEALQQLRQFIFRSILEAARENRISYTWYYKCIVDCGNQEDFNEALRLTCSIVNVNPNWTKETLNRMKKFIKCSSSKVDIFPDYSDRNKTFLLFLLRCLDWISSIRVLEWNEDIYDRSSLFFNLYVQLKEYLDDAGQMVFQRFLSLYQPFPERWEIEIEGDQWPLFYEMLSHLPSQITLHLMNNHINETDCAHLFKCLKHIFHLSCSENVLLTCCKVLYPLRQRKANLLFEKLGQTIEINNSHLKDSSCKYLGKLMSLSGQHLSLTLTPKAITLRGLLLLCKSWQCLQTLRITEVTIKRISKLIRMKRKKYSVNIKKIVILRDRQHSTIKGSHLISNLSIILRHWSISKLDLSSCDLDGHLMINLLSLQDPIHLKLSKKTLQDLAITVYEAQDVLLLKNLLQKFGINKRLSQMLLKIIFDSGRMELIDLWLQLSEPDYHVNFNSMELCLSHRKALRLITEHSCDVRLSMLCSSFTDEMTEELLSLIGRVSKLCLDRNTLLRFLHKLTEVNQPQIAQNLFKALHWILDFSLPSTKDNSSDNTSDLHLLSFTDCLAISKSLRLQKNKITLNISNCDIEDDGLEILFRIFDKVHLRTDKQLLLRLLSMVDENNKRRIISLGTAINSTIDLSGTPLSVDNCRSLANVMNYTENDCVVNLSNCSLSNRCINQLTACLHKIQDLDLSDNKITDSGATTLHKALHGKANLKTVRLYNNMISNHAIFAEDPRYEI